VAAEGNPRSDRLGLVLFTGTILLTALIVLAAYVYTWVS
jgi:hypothetical protein